jgi:RNA polymerase sigma-70 factor (ECF subfamily)
VAAARYRAPVDIANHSQLPYGRSIGGRERGAKSLTEKDLDALYRAHRKELWAFLLRRVRRPDVAADLLQEIFLRLAEQPAGLGVANMRAYLYRTAQNLATDHFRREERRQTFPTPIEELAELPEDAPSLEQAAADRQRLEAMRRIVAELPPRTRQVFELNRIDGLTYEETARRLGISESSVQKHLAQALLHVMQRMKSL